METLRQYILSVCSAAILCGILSSLFQKNKLFTALIKMLTGMFLVVVLITPLKDIELPVYEDFFNGISLEASDIADSAYVTTNESIETLIKQKTQAYILDKVMLQGFDAEIQVELKDSAPPTPLNITIIGNIPPLTRQKLSEQLSVELDVAKENIQWKLSP